ncbi:MAG: MFS transporter [Opitutaceae bacterium]|nr:MFS transporter [Opitutaceae bacterium]
MVNHDGTSSLVRIYWTAFIGLLFDYYDLYLFVYLEKTLAAHFALTPTASDALQFVGLAGVGAGALGFGWLADRLGRGRMMLAVFGVYVLGIAGLSTAWNYPSLLAFRLVASLALGAEWGISHTYLAERVDRATRYRFAALLQFAILGGLLAALARNYLLLVWGWRWLFAASIVPVVLLSLMRWKMLAREDSFVGASLLATKKTDRLPTPPLRRGQAGSSNGKTALLTFDLRLSIALRSNAAAFAVCFGLASLTIASGTINVFFAKDLPQSTIYTVFFWGNVVPGMLAGAWVVRKLGVGQALAIYAAALVALSVWAWGSAWPPRMLAFALVLPLLNGIPFGLMGAFFNEVFGGYRTMLSGAAYNLGRILAGFSPALITALGLHCGGNYFLFTAVLGAGVLALSAAAARLPARL